MRDKLYCKSQIQALCAPAEFCWHLMGKIWYCVQTKSYWKLIFWEINLKFGTQFVQIYGFDFQAGLEFNMFHKIMFINLNLYNFFLVFSLFKLVYFNNNLPWFFFKMRPNWSLCSQASNFYDIFLTWTFLSTINLCATFFIDAQGLKTTSVCQSAVHK